MRCSEQVLIKKPYGPHISCKFYEIHGICNHRFFITEPNFKCHE